MTKQAPYKLHDSQKIVAKTKERFVVLNCGRRFGKSFFATERMIYTAVTKEDANIAYFATTQGHARDIMWKMLKNRIADIAVSINEQRMEVIVHNKHGGTSSITLRGWENLDTARGQYFDLIVIDEAAFMRNFSTGMRAVLMPTLIDKKGAMLIISSPKGYNDFYDLYMYANSGRDKDWTAFTFTSYDNPTLDPAEIDRMKEKEDPDVFAQEYMAQFKKMSGLVVKAFDRRRHVIDCAEVDNAEITIAGLDWGWHTTASHTIKVRAGIYYVSAEYYVHEVTQDKTIEYIQNQGHNRVYPDPEDPDANVMLSRAGVNVYDVKKGKGSVEFGNSKLNELFLANRLFVDKSCENLIWELENYIFDENRSDPKPVKENDHGIDNLRYCVVSYEKDNDRHTQSPSQKYFEQMYQESAFNDDLNSPDIIV